MSNRMIESLRGGAREIAHAGSLWAHSEPENYQNFDAIEHFRTTRPKEARRLIISEGLSIPYPYKLIDKKNGISKIEKLMDDGYGIIFYTTHFSKGDPQRILAALMTASALLRKKEIVVPVARHQIDDPKLLLLSRGADLKVMSVHTPETYRLEDDMVAKKEHVPWILDPDKKGLNAYSDMAIKAVRNGNIVIAGPHATRVPQLKRFEGGPISLMDYKIKRAEDDAGNRVEVKLAYCFVGLEMPGIEDYSTVKGSNLGKLYLVHLGEVMTAEEFREIAKRNYNPNIKEKQLDQQARRELLSVVPRAYYPDDAAMLQAA